MNFAYLLLIIDGFGQILACLRQTPVGNRARSQVLNYKCYRSQLAKLVFCCWVQIYVKSQRQSRSLHCGVVSAYFTQNFSHIVNDAVLEKFVAD